MANFSKDYKNGGSYGQINFDNLFDYLHITKKMFNSMMCRFMYLLKKNQNTKRGRMPIILTWVTKYIYENPIFCIKSGTYFI